MSWPLESIGVAAPMFVPGAIVATWADIVMKVPALAARLPAGPTQTMTGTGELRIDLMISRVASSAPPGVSS